MLDFANSLSDIGIVDVTGKVDRSKYQAGIQFSNVLPIVFVRKTGLITLQSLATD
jgi:hypothetical protein